jgi:hypothetical protein
MPRKIPSVPAAKRQSILEKADSAFYERMPDSFKKMFPNRKRPKPKKGM